MVKLILDPTQFLKKPPERSDPGIPGQLAVLGETLKNSDGISAQCKALLVGVAGAANIVRPNGSVAAGVPLQQGYNPITCIQINTGTSASNIWPLYDA